MVQRMLWDVSNLTNVRDQADKSMLHMIGPGCGLNFAGGSLHLAQDKGHGAEGSAAQNHSGHLLRLVAPAGGTVRGVCPLRLLRASAGLSGCFGCQRGTSRLCTPHLPGDFGPAICIADVKLRESGCLCRYEALVY